MNDGNGNQPEAGWEFKPGDTIMPTGSAATPPSPDSPQPPVAPAAAVETQSPVDLPDASESPAHPPEEPQAIVANATAIPPQGPDGSISWRASEFIAHQKSAGWYSALGAGAIVLAAAIWLLTKDKISSGVVVVAALAFGAYGARQPRELDYRLDAQGLTIGARQYLFGQFRSFSIMPEGAFNSIVFAPLQRFAPLTTIYYDPADEEKIVSILADRLPMERRQKDLLDRLMWRMRF